MAEDIDPHDELATLAQDPELASMFVAEALDHLGTIEAVVLQLESAPTGAGLLDDLFRPFHTIKGNAGALGLASIQEVAHAVESLLDLARAGRHRIGAAEIEVVLGAVDLLTLMIRELPARLAGQPPAERSAHRLALIARVEALLGGDAAPDQAAPSPAAETTPAPSPMRRWDDGQPSIKVDTRKLDNLVDMVGELVIAQAILAEDPALQSVADDRLMRRLTQLRRITGDLQRTAMALRMVPVRQTFQKMGRFVRDLSRKAGKPVELRLSGEDTELDRKVVEEIGDPLMHMVRNSIDHGIEPPAVRKALGKPDVGVLRLSACHQGGSIVIDVADDGAGLDTEKILAKARARGLVAEDASPAAADIHQLIFQPGFSTADTVTELSGRGVGMDVVRRNIEALRGRIEIHTVRGQGTTFSIRLPLTLAIVDGILVGVGAERFVVPAFAVRESLRPNAAAVHEVHGQGRVVAVRDRLIPIVHLGELFGVEGAVRDVCEGTLVVIEDNGRLAAVAVDRLLGKQEVVVKALGEAFDHVQGIAGGAILGDGRIGLILDAGGLVASIEKPPREVAA